MEGSFDLLAAALRADSRDLKTFVEALATKLQGALPGRVTIERAGMFGGKGVKQMSIELGEERYELAHDDGRVSCRRRNVVRGIVLKNSELDLDQWIDELARDLHDEAQRTERGREAVERLLSE